MKLLTVGHEYSFNEALLLSVNFDSEYSIDVCLACTESLVGYKVLDNNQLITAASSTIYLENEGLLTPIDIAKELGWSANINKAYAILFYDGTFSMTGLRKYSVSDSYSEVRIVFIFRSINDGRKDYRTREIIVSRDDINSIFSSEQKLLLERLPEKKLIFKVTELDTD
jgi:sulfur relay (sulfurtransferase) DsrF/TusC family protein